MEPNLRASLKVSDESSPLAHREWEEHRRQSADANPVKPIRTRKKSFFLSGREIRRKSRALRTEVWEGVALLPCVRREELFLAMLCPLLRGERWRSMPPPRWGLEKQQHRMMRKGGTPAST